VSNDPEAPFSGAGSSEGAPDGAAHNPPPPPYAAPQYSPPQDAMPQASAPGGYPPPAPGTYTGAPPAGGVLSQAGQPADLMPRFLARLIDYVILLVVNVVIVAVVVIGAIMGDTAGFGGFGATNFAAGAVSAVLGAILYVGYFSFMESSRGQTIGKMALGLTVQGPDGNRPTMAEAVKRNAWAGLGVLGIVPVIGGLIGGLLQLAAVIYIAVTINNNVATRQGWHDQFAGGTRVVKKS
jgi:uncharacterized RDD family membrane protein YckC